MGGACVNFIPLCTLGRRFSALISAPSYLPLTRCNLHSSPPLQFNRCDANDEHHIVRMLDFFLFRKHLCLVFEKLDVNLFELLKVCGESVGDALHVDATWETR